MKLIKLTRDNNGNVTGATFEVEAFAVFEARDRARNPGAWAVHDRLTAPRRFSWWTWVRREFGGRKER